MDEHGVVAEVEGRQSQDVEVHTVTEPQHGCEQQRQQCHGIGGAGLSPFLAAQAALSQLNLPRQPGFKPAWLIHAAMRRQQQATLAEAANLSHTPHPRAGATAVLCSHASVQPVPASHDNKAPVLHGTPTTGRPASAASSHHLADSMLHCHSAGLLHVPVELQSRIPGTAPSRALNTLAAPLMLQPAASLAGAAAASIVTSVVTAAIQAARQETVASPEPSPQLSKMLPACLLNDCLLNETGAMAIGASAAALAASMAFLPSVPGAAQCAPTTSSASAAVTQTADHAASCSTSGEASQLEAASGSMQVQQNTPTTQPTADGLALCTFCGGERPCHAPCPLAVATAALQGLHLQGIYSTGRFRVACFVGDKPTSCVVSPCASQQASPRGSPTCSPTASSHSLCSALAPSSVLSSPSKAVAAGSCASIATMTPPSSQGAGQSQDALPMALPTSPSNITQLQASPQAAPLQLQVTHHAGSGQGTAHMHEVEQQATGQAAAEAAGHHPVRSWKVVSRHQGLSRPSKTQRRGRFMVVEYNDLVDAAKAAAMAAMVSAGDEDGGEAAAKAAALHVVRDAAQPVASLASSTSALTLADTSCMMQQAASDPHALADTMFSLHPAPEAAAAAPLTAEPVAAAAAAVAAAALLDHAASSIAHAAISAATQSGPPPLAFDSLENQAAAVAALGWQPHDVAAGAGALQAGGAHGAALPVSPFLIHGPSSRDSQMALAGFANYGSAPVCLTSSMPHEAAARLWLSDGGTCPAAAKPAAKPDSAQGSPITPSGERLPAPGSHMDGKVAAVAVQSVAPPAPRAYRKGRFSIQEISKEPLPAAATSQAAAATASPQIAGLDNPSADMLAPPAVVCPPQSDSESQVGCRVVTPGLVPLPAPGCSTVYAVAVPTAKGWELSEGVSGAKLAASDRTASSQLPPLSHTISEHSSMGDVGVDDGSAAVPGCSSHDTVERVAASVAHTDTHTMESMPPARAQGNGMLAADQDSSSQTRSDGHASITLATSWRRNLDTDFVQPVAGVPLAPAPWPSVPVTLRDGTGGLSTDVVVGDNGQHGREQGDDGQQGRDQGVPPVPRIRDQGSFQLVPMLPSELQGLRDASRSYGWQAGQLRDLLSSRSEQSLAVLRSGSAASVDTGTGISFAEWALQSKKLNKTEPPLGVLGDVDQTCASAGSTQAGEGILASFSLDAVSRLHHTIATHQVLSQDASVNHQQVHDQQAKQPASRSWSWVDDTGAHASPKGATTASSSSSSSTGLHSAADTIEAELPHHTPLATQQPGVVGVAETGSSQPGLKCGAGLQDQHIAAQPQQMPPESMDPATAGISRGSVSVRADADLKRPGAHQQPASHTPRSKESAPASGTSKARKVGRFTIIDS